MQPQYQPATTDPVFDAYTALWTMLEANADFMGWFGDVRRRIKLNADWIWAPNPDPDSLALADFPRIRLAWNSVDAHLEQDSCGSQPEWFFTLQIWTGSQQQTLLMRVIWPILRAFTTWRQYVRDVVLWNGNHCVYDVDPIGFKIDNPDMDNAKQDARGYDQWITLGHVSVKFNFKTTDLQAV